MDLDGVVLGGRRVDNRGQNLIINFNGFCAIIGLSLGVGDHNGDMVADVVDLADCKSMVGR